MVFSRLMSLCVIFTVSLCVHVQSFLKHKDAKPLRDVLASNPNRFVPLLVPAGTAATVRPGSPSTTTARLDLQFQAIKVYFFFFFKLQLHHILHPVHSLITHSHIWSGQMYICVHLTLFGVSGA